MAVYAISFVLIRTLSRYREYAADRGSALITGAPEYLMSALQKISSQMTLIPQQDLRQVEGMNAFFIIPARAKTMAELFMDHPPLEKRLAALAEIAREMGKPVSKLAKLALRSLGYRTAPYLVSGGWSRCDTALVRSRAAEAARRCDARPGQCSAMTAEATVEAAGGSGGCPSSRPRL